MINGHALVRTPPQRTKGEHAMTTTHIEIETRAMNALTEEVREALATQDTTTARDALGEMEGIWMNTECPDIREQAAAFMREHAAHSEYVGFSA
jgi:hypothetical protein